MAVVEGSSQGKNFGKEDFSVFHRHLGRQGLSFSKNVLYYGLKSDIELTVGEYLCLDYYLSIYCLIQLIRGP